MGPLLPPIAVDVLRVWLTGFLGVVGYMKGAGNLWHPLSTLAGPIELFGAFLQVPLIFGSFKQSWNIPASHTLSVLGCHCFTFALGLILSTYKRKGFVCWSQALLTVIYLYSLRPLSKGLDLSNHIRNSIAAVYCMCLAIAVGIMLQADPDMFKQVEAVCPACLWFIGLVVLPYSMSPLQI